MAGYSDQLPGGEVRPLYYFDRHLIWWRDADGDAHVMDAFCPHLGAHLGHGGHVDGTQLVCPFHGWKFDAEGVNCEIPYSERVNRKGRVATYPTIERNGMVMFWYHPDGAEPQWDIPEVPEFAADNADWSTTIRFEHEVEAALQEMAENGVDSPHFRFVHNTATVPELESYETEGPFTKMLSSQKFVTPRGVVEARIDNQQFGPGLALVNFGGIVDTVNLAATTPIDHTRCVTRFNFRFKTLGDEQTTANVGKAFCAEVEKQFLEDKPIWEHKAHLVRPALADTDGPIMKFRRWISQFYAEPVDDERTVFPPPYWPDRMDDAPAKATASARIGE
jgi:phenylpropionate dioxygenase-like ring-hydroxylating dioxygenase large terminal subunit